MTKLFFSPKGLTLVLCLFVSGYAHAQSSDLKEGFKTPPSSAMPRTWWHWVKGNITKEGITKDLEWMKRSGIAGLQLSDVASGSGQDVSNKIMFGSPQWYDAVHFAATEAERLNLEMAIFTSPGWSITGGPWVEPKQAMKKLVWSETTIQGGKTYTEKLPQPPSNIGPIRNMANGNAPATPGFYADFAVVAYRTPQDELAELNNQPVITTSNGKVNADALLDDDLNSSVSLKSKDKTGPVWIQFEYAQPYKAKAITVSARRGIPFGQVTASTDGRNFKVLAELPGKQGYRGGTVRTFAFPETTAKYYRVEFTAAAFKPAEVISQATTLPDTAYTFSEMKLYSGARVNRWEDKAGFNFMFEYESTGTPQFPASAVINPSDIVVLTNKMSEDGTLKWDVPAGNWTIMRFGYSLTGAKNRPPVATGLGYEADKLSAKHMEAYMEAYTKPLVKELGSLYGKRLQYMMMDSWEAGIQNWTDEMPAEFKKRRGYDITPYLPAMAGKVVGNSEMSDRFLWDFRRTLVDMFAENHYGTVTKFLHKQGLKTYGEAGGVSLEGIEDAILNKKFVDIPMGEFWVKDLHPSSMYYQDVRGAASASHVYGKNLVAAESFTGGNFESPYTLKKVSDYWLTQGINRLVFHTSAHQPLDTKPGNAMVGTHINRNITWAEKAKPFFTYLARNSYLLQQGRYVADLVYLLNEGAPSTMPFWGAGLVPAKPEGYDYDYINADALITRMSVNESGKLELPDKTSYAVLVLPQTKEMSLPVLRKIKELANAGATIAGPKPVQTPGLEGYLDPDQEVNKLTNEVWGDLDGVSRTIRTYGKGNIIWGMPLADVLKMVKTVPDVAYSKPLDTELSWLHRTDNGKEIYFVVNKTDAARDYSVRFRVNGKQPELWHADTGTSTPASYSIKDGQTTVDLHLEEREAVFVIFDKNTTVLSQFIPEKVTRLITTLTGPWVVNFDTKFGGPEKVTFDKLTSWTDSPAEGIKYYSGTAVYHKTFDVTKAQLVQGEKILLNLGEVSDMAEVYLNKVKLDTLWKAPFQADITKAVKAGKNQLEIRVTNEWTNRMVGDQAAPDKKILDNYVMPFGGKYKTGTSGLLGPVKLIAVKN